MTVNTQEWSHPKVPFLDVGTLGADGVDHADVRASYDEHGTVLLRGLTDLGEGFEQLVEAITGETLLEYTSGATPRSPVRGRVYTSTDFPAHAPIDHHSEMAYAARWPLHLAFYCSEAATSGGATPITPTEAVLERIPDRLRDDLLTHGVTYRRCFTPLLGESWSAVYGTDDLDELSARMADRGERLELDDGNVCALITLPATLTDGDSQLWFNQAVAYNMRTLTEEVRNDLLEIVGERGIPKNSFLGDGRPFEDDEIEAIRAAVDEVTIAFPWTRGDLLLVDNRRFAHGRQPYTGKRAVHVCMTGLGAWPDHR